MKKILSFFLAFFIISSLFSTFFIFNAIGESMESLGFIKSLNQEILSHGLVYTELSAKKDNNQKAYIFEYTPNSFTQPQVEYGSDASSKVRLKDIALRYEQNGSRVVGAMNGDFFSIQTGIPMGVVIKDGTIISSDPSKNAIGFTEQGFAVIGNPNIRFNFSCNPSEYSNKVKDLSRKPYEFSVDYFNKYPSVYAIYFLNDAYSSTTKSSSPSTEIILKPTSGDFKTNSSMTFEVTSVLKDATNSKIPDGHFVLCGDNNSFAKDLSVISEGDILKLDIVADYGWDDVKTAMGGGDIIIENGLFLPETVDELHEKIKNPRTAIGVRENGEVVFFANDGRDSENAAGLTIKALADIMLELDCVTAINLDGGGSTTVYATTPYDSSAKLVNNPSDGSERYISNAVIFLNNLPDSQETGGVKLTSDYEYMMVGSHVYLDAKYHNKSYRPFVPVTPTIFEEQPVSNKKLGSFDKNIFTANNHGSTTLAAVNGNTKGLWDMTVLSSPSEFIFKGQEIVVPIGESVPIELEAMYYENKVAFNNYDVLNFEISEYPKGSEQNTQTDFSLIGHIEDNNFYANEYFKGFINFFMEDTSIEIPLQIIPKPYRIDIQKNITADFNGKSLPIEDSDEAYLEKSYFTISTPETFEEQVNVVTLNCKDLIIDKDSEGISFLSKNLINAQIVITDGEKDFVIPYLLERNYGVSKGWYKFKANLDSLVFDDQKEYLVKQLLTFNANPDTYYIFGDFCQITAPEMLFIDIEDSWAKEHIINVYYQELMKGKPYYTTSMFDGNSPLTRAEFATILCRLLDLDTSLYSGITNTFEDLDTVGEWAWNQINTVNMLGLMQGSTEDDGKQYFRPQDGLTRAEAMQVIGRLLKTPSEVSSLNFSDLNLLPSWATENTAKVVTYNIFSGYQDNTLRPLNKLTRNEAAKILSLFNTQSFFDLINFDSINQQLVQTENDSVLY